MNVRDQLLQAAAKVYAEAGYRGATTRRIAAEAGVNEITLFRHFGSKDSLLREAIARSHAVPGHLLPDEPDDPAAELAQWATAHLATLRARRALIRTCMGDLAERAELIASEDSGPVQAARALTAYLRRLRERGLARARFDESAAAAMLMGVLFADAMGRDVMRQMFATEPEAALREYLHLFLRGIGVDTGARKGVS